MIKVLINIFLKNLFIQLSRLGSDYLRNVPLAVRDHVSLLLNAAGDARPDAGSTITVFYLKLMLICFML